MCMIDNVPHSIKWVTFLRLQFLRGWPSVSSGHRRRTSEAEDGAERKSTDIAVEFKSRGKRLNIVVGFLVRDNFELSKEKVFFERSVMASSIYLPDRFRFLILTVTSDW